MLSRKPTRLYIRNVRHLQKLVFVLLTVTCTASQTLEVLHSFGTLTNQLGIKPEGRLVASSNGVIYGVTSDGFGGGLLKGTIFSVKTNGSDFRILKQFTNILEGSRPRAGLLLAGNTLFGMTTEGGVSGSGTIFKVSISGNAFEVLAALPPSAWDILPNSFQVGAGLGTAPIGGLSIYENRIFGATRGGGSQGAGTIFSVSTSGHDFTILKEFTPAEGIAPCGDLVILDGMLYGTTSGGGSNRTGTIFKLSNNGSGFTTLRHFSNPRMDGAVPLSGLTFANGKLYGTTSLGGSSNFFGGTIFSIHTDGSEFSVLRTFSPQEQNGTTPVGLLFQDGQMLYGVTSEYGSSDVFSPASIYSISISTGIFTNLGQIYGKTLAGVIVLNSTIFHATLSGFTTDAAALITSRGFDGSSPKVIASFPISSVDPMRPNPLTLVDSFLFGTTVVGGQSNAGTLFRVHTNGTEFRVLKEFGGADGSNPRSRLTSIGNSLYGVCSSDVDLTGLGTIFRIQSDGTGFTVLHRFGSILADGYRALGQPILFNGYLYGTTGNGGESSNGTVYRIKPDGSGYEVLKSFFQPDGVHPIELTLSGNTLFGTCFFGGNATQGRGTFFEIDANGGVNILWSFTTTYPPIGRLVAAGGILYGTAFSKTAFTQPRIEGRLHPLDVGEVVSIEKNGTNSTIVARLTGDLRGDVSANGLVLSGDKLIGTLRGNSSSTITPPDSLIITRAESPETKAAIFLLNTNGIQTASIYAFSSEKEGTWLNGDVVVDGEVLYGTAYAGGPAGGGTIFRLDLRPRLQIAAHSDAVRVSWPQYAGKGLQLSTNLSDWHHIAQTVSEGESRFSVLLPSTNQTASLRLNSLSN